MDRGMKASELSLLVVDDDPMVRSALASFAEARGYRFAGASGVGEAREVLGAQPFDAVLLDLYLPDGDGLAVLDRALEIEPRPVVIVITARAAIHGAVTAIHRGATDYLAKPLDFDDLGSRLERALEDASMRRRLALLDEQQKERSSAVARSVAMKDVLGVAARVAATPMSSALLIGESGVGKEIVASYIHETSERRQLQPKLLRALEERRFFPLGSDRERRMNVRVLAATNRDPMQMIGQGLLREDLYYRLSTIVIRIPPLRERKDDILPLATHFLARFRVELGRPRAAFTSAAEDALLAYAWPGNVRELRNVVERSMIVAESGAIGRSDLGLPLEAEQPQGAGAARQAVDAPESLRLDEMEKRHILLALERARGSKTQAAAMLGVSRSTLWEKSKRYGID
jgi:DNA-binding NtrC family response regulator